MKKQLTLLLTLAFSSIALAQNTELKEVQVSATRIELNEADLPKQVIVITAEEISRMAANSVSEVLEYAAGLDVRNRGVMDAQTDISIRGGSFDQTLILVDGVKMNDPQTGHHAMNLSLSKEQIERIEIIPSGAARVFGAGAFAGAINIITKKADKPSLRIEGIGGMHGLVGGNILLAQPSNKGGQTLAINYLQHKGFMENTDFQNLALHYKKYWTHGRSDWEFNTGYNQKAFGAQAFYSTRFPYQFETTRMANASLSWKQSSNKFQQRALAYYRAHSDRFELFREGEDWFQRQGGFLINSAGDTAQFGPGSYYMNHNFHIGQSAGLEYSATYKMGKHSKLNTGLEVRYESVLSNVLGEVLENPRSFFLDNDAFFTVAANRINHAYYLDYLYEKNRWIFSTGITLNANTDFAPAWLPGAELLYKVSNKSRVWASYNQSLRLPTYTDLYYRIGGAQGSIDLQPEFAQTWELGYRYQNQKIQWNIAAYTRLGQNLIDWIRPDDQPDVLQAANLTEVWAYGYDSRLRIKLPYKHLPYIIVGSQWQDLRNFQEGFTSIYALDVLTHKHSLQTHWIIHKNLSLNLGARFESRKGDFIDFDGLVQNYPDAWLLDAKLSYKKSKWEAYLEGLNLLDQQYFNRGNIPMPGIWLRAGMVAHIY